MHSSNDTFVFLLFVQYENAYKALSYLQQAYMQELYEGLPIFWQRLPRLCYEY